MRILIVAKGEIMHASSYEQKPVKYEKKETIANNSKMDNPSNFLNDPYSVMMIWQEKVN